MIFTLLPCSGITPKKREWISFKIRLSWVSGKSQGTHLKSIITNTNIQTQTQTCLISEKKNQNSRKERNKMPETENRPRGEVRSQREERQCLHTNKNNKLLVAECIDNDIIDMTSSLIEIALRIRVQHFFLTGQGRWRERRRRRRRRKSGTCQNTQIYYQLSVSGSENARVCALALSNFVCVCGCSYAHTCAGSLALAARHVFVRLPVVVVILAIGSWLSRSLYSSCCCCYWCCYFIFIHDAACTITNGRRGGPAEEVEREWNEREREREREGKGELGSCLILCV